MKFSPAAIDMIRHSGFRPTAVACFVFEKKVLLVHHAEYNLWQLPQGGIDNGEVPEETLAREAKEELGASFCKSVDFSKMQFIGRDRVEFHPEKYNVRTLQSDSGEALLMTGKEYLFFAVPVFADTLKKSESEFDIHEWHTFTSVQKRISEIYQPGKQRITERAVQFLFDENFIKAE